MGPSLYLPLGIAIYLVQLAASRVWLAWCQDGPLEWLWRMLTYGVLIPLRKAHGNLSHQIEHHLFPDLPSNRYAEVAPKVKALFDKYDLNYHEASLPAQVYSAWHKLVRLSLPNGWLATTNVKNLPEQSKLLWAMSTKGPKVRRAATARLQQQRGGRPHRRLTPRARPTSSTTAQDRHPPSAASTTSRASSCTWARCSAPWNDSA